MEASAYYQQFERNVYIILDALAVGLDLRTTALSTSIPLEVYVLCEVLNQGGAQFQLTTEGLDRLREFQTQYMQRESETEAIMRRLLEDKRAMMRTPEGRVLIKEMLIRRLEFFNEAARQVNVMRIQQSLGSPPQHRSGIGAALQK
ncbi:hypothetical protein MTX78_18785 [Hymenobacter tibetensis]|uniref:Uncharacterized protein n=1 Tax=Hymenobacter tibetensis TaxID=497967 RepID=A0ABY4CV70_9BACT|nr:hypothetical protein [Hymenobacter tibetensis]UOG74155.1 hypothetical protein MTX78_18785 [Hymenobacter tibetensis]